MQGSVELAPLVGLADLIVDLVETGETLRQNGLVEREKICDISTVVIANRVALKLKREPIGAPAHGARVAALLRQNPGGSGAGHRALRAAEQGVDGLTAELLRARSRARRGSRRRSAQC